MRKSCVSLEAGARARHKVVGVEGLGVEQVELRIRELLRVEGDRVEKDGSSVRLYGLAEKISRDVVETFW